MIVILDASVILKWVLPRNISPFQAQALAIRDAALSDSISLRVPPLWRYEVGNSLTRLIPDNALQLMMLCESVGLTEVKADDKWLEIAVGLVRRSKVSFYDAAYHALAIAQSAVFVTADEKYVSKSKPSTHMRLLKDWP
jgi:predicted nucleic acid-binding protein